ncbi:MAG: hypothetical protein JSU73_01595, partial [candidate division WOR-3 bacterium]
NPIVVHTTSFAGLEEERPRVQARPVLATLVRGVLRLQGCGWTGEGGFLLDVTGRRVGALKHGDNDVSQLVPGIYFVVTPSPQPSGAAPGFAKPPEGERMKERGARPAASVRKIVVQR